VPEILLGSLFSGELCAYAPLFPSVGSVCLGAHYVLSDEIEGEVDQNSWRHYERYYIESTASAFAFETLDEIDRLTTPSEPPSQYTDGWLCPEDVISITSSNRYFA
jgi:hypothetical protein